MAEPKAASSTEAERQLLMAHYDLPDGGVAAFDPVTHFAAELCESPVALVSIVETCRQRFIAGIGLDATETPREQSFCAHAMLGGEVMIVPDARADPRFADNALVTGAPHIRFYAGAPLVSREGVPLGALCVIDREPRAGLTPLQIQGLTVLADQIMARLEAGRTAKERAEADRLAAIAIAASERRFRVLADAMPQMVWSARGDGFHDYYNARWYEFVGGVAGGDADQRWADYFHPDDQDRARTIWTRSLQSGEPYEIEYRLRHHSGEYRWTLGRALPMRDEQGRIVRWFGTCTDIHEQKLTLEQREVLAHELSHRIKNIFSVIGGLIGFSARAHPEMEPAIEELRERVMALGRAHDFVRPHSAKSAKARERSSLAGLLADLFEPYGRSDARRLTIAGDDVEVDDRSATPLAMIFHELATNAAKYGALSVEKGTVSVSITERDGLCIIDWAEQGGPAVKAPPREDGFGTRLIAMSGERQLGGTVSREWAADGLRVRLAVPVTAMSRQTA